MEITLRAYGKVNLGLDVLRKLENGYHEVKMIMQTVDLYDLLTFEKMDGAGVDIHSSRSDLPVGEDNIIYKACKLMMSKYEIKGGVKVTLEKNIPVAAGMAGGSTDAAAALIAMNSLYDLGLTQTKLMELGVEIGADVPYCVMQGTALSEGIGEKLTALAPMPECTMVIAKPPVGVSTKWVYQNLKVSQLSSHPDIDGMAEALENGDLEGITDRMANVLETVTIPAHMEIGQIKDMMLENGAMNSLMSGSGPTVFGIYDDADAAEKTAEKLKESGLAEQVYVTLPYNGKR